MQYEMTVEVDAPADRLWHAVADVEKWPQWTASMREVSWLTAGGLVRGGRAQVRQPAMPALVWEVCDLEPGTSFSWRTASPGLTTTAVHRVQPVGAGKSKLTIGIAQSGLMAGFVGLLVGRRTWRSIRLEADGLKRCAEDWTGPKS
jgi:uncharacterized membrane protein